MSIGARAWLAAGILLAAGSAQAATLDRVRQDNTVRCGAAQRAGVADPAEDGRVTGLAVDLCRALTIAVLGPSGHTEFHIDDSDKDYEQAQHDEVSFLTADEIAGHRLAAALIPGPPVFVAELTALALPGVDTLTGRMVCFMNGSPAHQALEAWAARTGTAIVRGGYQEDGEMHDAFDARRCDAMTGEATDLAALRAEAPSRAGDHILPPFAVVPVLATTPVQDGSWASLVNWSLAAIVQSETKPSPWRSDLVGADVPGLRPKWQAEVASVLGSYADMLGRNMPSGLTAQGNAPWPAGLLLPPGPR
ncbi:hypothetical protein [Acidisphaera sp. L21]|uniref:hypothetical protein n=1 Tax=Acidisphaera sp. L21 TaxID=1641851 RepID=UPI00131DA291|nr:hypothetical protein [Acidisphaera sp. L21]